MIKIIKATSGLGLTATGVEGLADALLDNGLKDLPNLVPSIITLAPAAYTNSRKNKTEVMNQAALVTYSESLSSAIVQAMNTGDFLLVLGGDCSILIGIMHAFRSAGSSGLLFFDAHADFYSTTTSTTGEAADMDLAIVTGHGPDVLTNITGLKPYVEEKNVIHIGQRDQQETQAYGSPDIRESEIRCISLEAIRSKPLDSTISELQKIIQQSGVDNFWIHFDTDVLSDDINPAVDYRLKGGMQIDELQQLFSAVISTGKVRGMSVSIYNPSLDPGLAVARLISNLISAVLQKV